MLKTFVRVVAVCFGVLLIGKTAYVEYLFHSGNATLSLVPDVLELVLVWGVSLFGVTSFLVRSATPVVTHVTNVVNRPAEREPEREPEESTED